MKKSYENRRIKFCKRHLFYDSIISRKAEENAEADVFLRSEHRNVKNGFLKT